MRRVRRGRGGGRLGYVGLVCSAIILVASAAMMGQFTIILSLLWALCLGVAFLQQPAAS